MRKRKRPSYFMDMLYGGVLMDEVKHELLGLQAEFMFVDMPKNTL